MSNRKHDYDNAILIFALVQVAIAILQFVFSIFESTNSQARWFGGISIFVLMMMFWWIMRRANLI